MANREITEQANLVKTHRCYVDRERYRIEVWYLIPPPGAGPEGSASPYTVEYWHEPFDGPPKQETKWPWVRQGDPEAALQQALHWLRTA